MIIKLINGINSELESKEANSIFQCICNKLESDKCETIVRRYIKPKLVDYFNYNNVLNIEGFIKFRLNSYISYLVDIISLNIEEYLTEKEYNEFISLLKKYVMLQNSKYKSVEVVLYDSGFCIYDEYGADITKSCVDAGVGINNFNYYSYEDILLNILITAAPETIILYVKDGVLHKEFVKTLVKVFDKNISVVSTGETDFNY